MENQEMVMENSWKNILSSLWEPCERDSYNKKKYWALYLDVTWLAGIQIDIFI